MSSINVYARKTFEIGYVQNWRIDEYRRKEHSSTRLYPLRG